MFSCDNSDIVVEDLTLPDQEVQVAASRSACEPACATYDGTYISTVILEDYPNCPQEFSVDFCVTFEEIDGTATTPVVNFSNVDWGPNITTTNDPDCQALWNDIVDVIQNGTNLEQQTFLNDAFEQAMDQLTENWIEEHLLESSALIECGELASSFHFNVIRTFNESNCYQLCLFSNGEIKRNPCGSGCCARTTGFCVDPETGEVIEEVYEETESFGPCESQGFFKCINSEGNPPFIVSPCIQRCD